MMRLLLWMLGMWSELLDRGGCLKLEQGLDGLKRRLQARRRLEDEVFFSEGWR